VDKSQEQTRLTNGHVGEGELKMRTLLAIVAVLCLSVPAGAVIDWSETKDFVLLKDKRTPGVTWSRESMLTDSGLVVSNAGEFWLQTGKVPAGLAWRPPTAAEVTLSIHVKDTKDLPPSLVAYVRYGCDGIHWSTWAVMSETKARAGAVQSYRASLRVPSVAKERYHALHSKWEQTEPDWSSDEDALCRWIARERPQFFEKELPLIGYLQFRLEDSSGARAVTITKLAATVSWGVGGLHNVPRKGKADYGKKWSFEGKP
jgi:hypothetical protein